MNSTTTTNESTILIISDYPLITNRISNILEEHFKVYHTNPIHFFNELHNTDIVLLCNTTKLYSKKQKDIINNLYNGQLIILTDPENIPYTYIGKTVFISLKEEEEKIVQTLKGITYLRKYCSSQVSFKVIKSHIITSAKLKNLTKREQEIYSYLTHSNKAIAQFLNISTSTVRSHILNINRKVGFDVRQKLLEEV